MSIKRFCDICNKEITDENCLPDPYEKIPVNYTVPIVNCYDVKHLYFKIEILRGKDATQPLPIDVCKVCAKEFINQL
jgi:hypothetical protein